MRLTITMPFTAAVVAAAGLPMAMAQDSVSTTPGVSDALSPYAFQRVRFVVDLVPLESSWGNAFAVAPLLKAGADPDPMFPTLLLGSSVVSADQVAATPTAAYDLWTVPGQGSNPDANNPPGTITPGAFSRQFGVAFNDLSNGPTNIVAGLVGQDPANPLRLYVTRVQALNSREDPVKSQDSATLALGSIDASGNVHVRADSFNSLSTEKIAGENIVRVAAASRSISLNRLRRPTTNNISTDPGATSYVLNNVAVSTNTPSTLPASLAGSPFAIVFDFVNTYRANGAAGVLTHLAAGVNSQRGNPSFAGITSLGGVGLGGSLARSTSGGGKVDSLNVFALSAAGAPSGPRAATLPVPITAGTFSANGSGNSQFLQYLSQVSFRGPSALVGLGFDPALNAPIAAATAKDPTAGEFIAVARFVNPSPTWTVAAWIGKPVRSGPTGAVIGTIAKGTPNAFSAPASDRQGNIYFVARYQPTAGVPTTALIKAVNVAGSEPYPLELLLKSGDSFVGANSNTMYTIESLTLSDSDSVASGAFNGASTLHGLVPGVTPTGAADPFAFSGAVVNAQISYNRAGTPEDYQAVLFLSPRSAPPPACPGDANGDNMVGLPDIAVIINNWNSTVPPGTLGDLSGDGMVGLADLAIVVKNWGTTCG